MKKFLLLPAMLGCALAYSQMVVQKLDGTQIKDGDIFTYNKPGIDGVNEDGILRFTVANSSKTESIKVKVLCESITNSDGEDFQFCFGGNCMPFVQVGQNYPPAGYTIAANSNSGDSDHFWNLKSESNDVMTYNFKFYTVDVQGNETGNPVRITYKYDKTMAVKETDKTAIIKLRSNFIKDNLEIISLKDANISLFDMNGKLILSKEIKAGNQNINVQSINAGVYILNSIDKDGKSSSFKIIKN